MKIKMLCVRLQDGRLLFKRAGLTKQACAFTVAQAESIVHARIELDLGKENPLGDYYVRDTEAQLASARKQLGKLAKQFPIQLGGRCFNPDEPDRGTHDCLYILDIQPADVSAQATTIWLATVECCGVELLPESKAPDARKYYNAKFRTGGQVHAMEIGTWEPSGFEIGKSYAVRLEYCGCAEKKGEEAEEKAADAPVEQPVA